MITSTSLVLNGFHLSIIQDSSWLICKIGQVYGEWDIDLVVLITRESDFSTSDPTLIQSFVPHKRITISFSPLLAALTLSGGMLIAWWLTISSIRFSPSNGIKAREDNSNILWKKWFSLSLEWIWLHVWNLHIWLATEICCYCLSPGSCEEHH